MREKSRILASLKMGTAAIILSVFCMIPQTVLAAPKVVDVEGVSYNVDASMADNLKSFMGKDVSVTTDSGKAFYGRVKEVGIHLIHLEKLQGKEHFDALIRIENISAIEARFREYQR